MTSERIDELAGGLPQGSRWKNIRLFSHRIENVFCILSLVFLALIPLAEVVARLFRTGVPASSGMMAHMLLVAAMLAGMITTRDSEHLAIGLVQHFAGDTVKRRLRVLTSLLSVFILTVIVWSSFSFIRIALGRQIGIVPDWVFASFIPIGYGIIALRFAFMSKLRGWKAVFPVLAVIGGTIASFPVIAKFIWGFDMPDAVFYLTDQFFFFSSFISRPLVVILILAALAGTPLFVIIGGLALHLLHAAGGEMDTVVSDIYSALTNPDIIAIPLFTLTGFFLSESKAGDRLVRAFRGLFNWLPGGTIIATVVICAFFTSFTGASGVTIVALGGILYVILSERMNYPAKFSIGLLTSVGSIGLLFPPSLPIILVGATTQTNIFHMFLGGIFPGLLLVLLMIIFAVIVSAKIKIPVEKFNFRNAVTGLKESSLEILMPIILITGFFTGILSLVEIGAAGLLYVFIVEVFIHRDIKLADVPKVFLKALPIIGGVLSILALSRALSFYIIDSQAPMNLASWMQNVVTSRIVFLLLLNLMLLIVGFFLDIFSAILVVLPLIVPLGQIYGIDPVHLGIIFLINLEVGYLTPPVGLNLFLASYRFNRSFIDICRFVFPFMIVRLAVVLLVTFIPELSTFLPSLF